MSTSFFVPTLGESIAEATLARWLRKAGEAVNENEPLCELETDKVAVEVPAPCSGVLSSLAVAEGDAVTPGAELGVIDENAKAPAPPPKTGQEAAPKIASEPSPASSEDAAVSSASASPAAAPLSPAVRRLVEERKLDASQIPASGRDGRLLKGDVLAFIEARPPAAPPAASPAPPEPSPAPAPASAPVLPAAQAGKGEEETRIPMTRLRKTIASRLKQAQQEAALLTTFNDVDMSAVTALRRQWRDRFAEKHGVKLGFMGFFVKAAVWALQEVPGVNARIEGEDIVYFKPSHIGVATATESGLVVPVIRNAETLSIADIEAAIADRAARARSGKLTPGDLQGGTFSITNGGVFGSLLSTPIVNAPQSAILGLHRIEERPVARQGEVVVRPMMYLALSYDHRLIDGREAVTFLVRVKEAIEDPARLLLKV